MVQFQVGVINDEISDDISEAFQYCADNKLDYINLRSKNQINIIDWKRADFVFAKQLSNMHHIPIYGIMSPFFKSSYVGSRVVNKNIDFPLPYHLDFFNLGKFETWIKNISICTPSILRVFSPLETVPNTLARWLPTLIDIQKVTTKFGIRVAIENEPVCHLSTFNKVVDFLAPTLKFENFGVIWDPCNDLSKNDLEFPQIRELIIEEVHIKDWCSTKHRWVPLGQGSLPLNKVISTYNSSNLCIETHVGKTNSEKKSATTQSLNALQGILAK